MIEFQEDFPFTTPRMAPAVPFPDHVEDVVLPADTLQRIAIPAGARFVLFSFDGDLRVKLGTVATGFVLPSVSGNGDGSGSELNPAARRLPPRGASALTHILLRAPAACRGSLAFYA